MVRYEFEKRGKEPFGAGGIGRLFVDGQKVAEGEIPTTAAFGYSLDETFDIGCDKGAPVTDEYRPLASFTGTIVKVDVDLEPDVASRRGASREGAVRSSHGAPVSQTRLGGRCTGTPRDTWSCRWSRGCAPRVDSEGSSWERRETNRP